jgi:GT2 family glycosyltransferase
MKVSILIASLDNIKYLRECIKTVKKNTKVQAEFIVLDLGDDGTDLWCEKERIKVYRQNMPFYFSQSANFLASKATGDYLLFLNPDTLPLPNFLEYMLEEAKQADIVGARLMYPNGTVQVTTIVWDEMVEHPGDPNALSRMNPELLVSKDCLAVCGGCMLVKKSVFDKIKFDEKFKNGYEDVDFCLQAGKKGYKVRYCGKAEITHYHGKSMGTIKSHTYIT